MFAKFAFNVRVMIKQLGMLSSIVTKLELLSFLPPLKLYLIEFQVMGWSSGGGILFLQITHFLRSLKKLKLRSLRHSGPFGMPIMILSFG